MPVPLSRRTDCPGRSEHCLEDPHYPWNFLLLFYLHLHLLLPDCFPLHLLMFWRFRSDTWKDTLLFLKGFALFRNYSESLSSVYNFRWPLLPLLCSALWYLPASCHCLHFLHRKGWSDKRLYPQDYKKILP